MVNRFLYGAFVWVRWALNSQKRRFPAPRAAASLVHCLLLQKVTSPRFTILNGSFRPGQGREYQLPLGVAARMQGPARPQQPQDLQLQQVRNTPS
jgi:hypothetical protein